MKRAIEPPQKHPCTGDTDDLLGKNSARRKNGIADVDPFADQKPARKRTEDLGDSL